MTCYAQRSGIDFYCAKCGLSWDHDDPEPPDCPEEVIVVETYDNKHKQQEMNFDA